ncbi:hypothetical protein C8J56DRAFT_897251 [Mycena floridula]|nr:hypothetical protein C8J56DRAFT_897251 [Mycena floridula]
MHLDSQVMDEPVTLEQTEPGVIVADPVNSQHYPETPPSQRWFNVLIPVVKQVGNSHGGGAGGSAQKGLKKINPLGLDSGSASTMQSGKAAYSELFAKSNAKAIWKEMKCQWQRDVEDEQKDGDGRKQRDVETPSIEERRGRPNPKKPKS